MMPDDLWAKRRRESDYTVLLALPPDGTPITYRELRGRLELSKHSLDLSLLVLCGLNYVFRRVAGRKRGRKIYYSLTPHGAQFQAQIKEKEAHK